MKNTIEAQQKVLNTQEQEAKVNIQETDQKIEENHMLQNKHTILKSMATTGERILLMMKVKEGQNKDIGIKMMIQIQKIQEHHTSK